MIDYGIVHGSKVPTPVEFTPNYVRVATDIQPYTETVDDSTIQGYQYHYVQYTKDEYLLLLLSQVDTLADELEATKILLGVD